MSALSVVSSGAREMGAHVPGRPLAVPANLIVGTTSLPYLADHVVRDIVVLPGAFYLDLALRVSDDGSRRGGLTLRNIDFRTPVVLGARDTVVHVESRRVADHRAKFTFFEGATDGAGPSPPRPFAARLEIDRAPLPASHHAYDASFIEAFKARSAVVIGAAPFYQTLREGANQYGPSFQRVAAVWRAGDECLGRLVARSGQGAPAAHHVHPGLLDSMTQLLAPFVAETGRTFMLRSIDRVLVTSVDFPETLWAHAIVRPNRPGESRRLRGDIRVFDEFGRLYLDFAGVTFDFVDDERAADAAAVPVAIASNFTAEPLEDSLRFWGDHFGVPIRPTFAPYDQVFQQLLDTGGTLRGNRDGVNVILLSLEEWIRHRYGAAPLDRERAEQTFGSRPRCSLPNGLSVVHLNGYETDYVYKEIFEEQRYLRHGITLDGDATVVDIGANIGLFSLFVLSRCRQPKIYAFEPSPVVYELLKTNCDAYGSDIRVVNAGVADRPRMATFTFYERSSVFSGFHANESDDRDAVQTLVRDILHQEPNVDGATAEEYAAELTADRLASTTHECRMTTVSEIMRDYALATIDLLKIDAEKSELEILEGIEDRDWPRIRQVVMEIHDRTGEATRRVEAMLTARGFACAVEQDRLLEHVGFCNLYATRPDGPRESLADDAAPLPAFPVLERNVRDFISALRTFIAQANAPLVLCICPRSPQALADRDANAALDAAETALLVEARGMSNVRVIDSHQALRCYPVREYFNPHTHRAGNIPYTADAYAAIGSAVFRSMVALKRQPFKVIVLDADNTLWAGVCGEDGPLGVEISPPYRRVQEFMLEQANTGMLLCLCSRNNEQDVADVFAQRDDMVLRREHLVGWRVNWRSKSDNVKSLAGDLNLGLDSFIFVDDNPVECADVRACCPGVLTVQLPGDATRLPEFLEHAWAFDPLVTTAEDRARTRLYRDNARRQRFRDESMSLRDFIDGLQVRVTIAEATENQIERISQLTFRTNQFNVTTVRRSENDVRRLLDRGDVSCLAVSVTDRFGDYGLVGVVAFERRDDRMTVDTFLLSCRVLGRGVEHAMLADLARRAVREGKHFVELVFRESGKNAPAREFLGSLGDHEVDETGAGHVFAAADIAELRYEPGDAASAAPDRSPASPRTGPIEPEWLFHTGNLASPLQQIAERLSTTSGLIRAVEESRLDTPPRASSPESTPASPMQTAVVGIWKRVLGRRRVGLQDNFFEVGGTSLKAVQVIAAIKKELNRSLSIVTLFECPTKSPAEWAAGFR